MDSNRPEHNPPSICIPETIPIYRDIRKRGETELEDTDDRWEVVDHEKMIVMDRLTDTHKETEGRPNKKNGWEVIVHNKLTTLSRPGATHKLTESTSQNFPLTIYADSHHQDIGGWSPTHKPDILHILRVTLVKDWKSGQALPTIGHCQEHKQTSY